MGLANQGSVVVGEANGAFCAGNPLLDSFPDAQPRDVPADSQDAKSAITATLRETQAQAETLDTASGKVEPPAPVAGDEAEEPGTEKTESELGEGGQPSRDPNYWRCGFISILYRREALSLF